MQFNFTLEQPQPTKNSSEMQNNKLYCRLFYDPDPNFTEEDGNVLLSRMCMGSTYQFRVASL